MGLNPTLEGSHSREFGVKIPIFLMCELDGEHCGKLTIDYVRVCQSYAFYCYRCVALFNKVLRAINMWHHQPISSSQFLMGFCCCC